MSATETIWAALTATDEDHRFESEAERLALEVGDDRAGAELAMEGDLKAWTDLIRLGALRRGPVRSSFCDHGNIRPLCLVCSDPSVLSQTKDAE